MRYFLALFLALSVVPNVAKADLIPDNSHSINNCIAVENIAEYPDYDFVWSISYRFDSAEKITSSEPLCYQEGGFELVAIKKTDWSKVQYPKEDPECPECVADAGWVTYEPNADLFLSSNYSIGLDRSVPDTNSAVKQVVTVHIDGVTDAGVTAHTASTLMTDTEGEEADETLSTLAKVLIAIGVLGVGTMICTWKKK